MENEKLILVLPGDKITITTDRPVKLYYRTVDVDSADRKFEIKL